MATAYTDTTGGLADWCTTTSGTAGATLSINSGIDSAWVDHSVMSQQSMQQMIDERIMQAALQKENSELERTPIEQMRNRLKGWL
jgi:hypothetical protein